MEIDEAGAYILARNLTNIRAAGRIEVWPELCDTAIPDAHVSRPLQ
jgi:hypothetical protein